MNQWDKKETIDTMLKRVGKTYKSKACKVSQWVADLTENRIWRGGNDCSRQKVRVPRRASPRKGSKSKSKSPKHKSPSLSSGTSTPRKVWTEGQREEATKRKADEADAAALNGVRKSRRARVPTEKVLDAE